MAPIAWRRGAPCSSHSFRATLQPGCSSSGSNVCFLTEIPHRHAGRATKLLAALPVNVVGVRRPGWIMSVANLAPRRTLHLQQVCSSAHSTGASSMAHIMSASQPRAGSTYGSYTPMLASTSMGMTATPPMASSEDSEEAWWVPHQQVVQLLTSSFWAACMLLGICYWLIWAVRKLAAMRANTSAPDAITQSLTDTTIGDGHATSRTAADTLDDPFAPIRYILWNTFNSGKASDQAAPSNLSTQPPGTDSAAAAAAAAAQAGSVLQANKGFPFNWFQPKQTPQPAGGGGASPSPPPNPPPDKEPPGSGNNKPHRKQEQKQDGMTDRWWAQLSKVHYINFGAKLGILPKIPMQAGLPKGAADQAADQALVAFADKVDAEYVAGVLRLSMQRAATPVAAAQELQALVAGTEAGGELSSMGPSRAAGVKPRVVAAQPGYLEDVSMSQRSQLVVVPQGLLPAYYNTQLNESEMLSLLADLVAGRTPSVLPAARSPTPSSSAVPSAGAAAAALGASITSSSSLGSDIDEGMMQGSLPGALNGFIKAVQGSARPGPPRQPSLDAWSTDPSSDTSSLSADAPFIPPVFDFPGFDTPADSTDLLANSAKPPTANGSSADGSGHLEQQPITAETITASQVVDPDGVGTAPGSWSRGAGPVVTAQVSDLPAQDVEQPFEIAAKPLRQQTEVGSQAATELTDGSSSSSAQASGAAPRVDPALDDSLKDISDPLLREYELFKRMFKAERDKPQPTTSQASSAPTSTESTPGTNQVKQEPSSKQQKKPSADMVGDLLSKTGPTDQTLDKAFRMIGVTDGSMPSSVLDEWYAFQKELQDMEAEEAAEKAARGDGKAAAAARQAVAAAAAAAKAGGSQPAAAEPAVALARMKAQLRDMEKQLQQLLGVPGQLPSVAALTEASALKQRMDVLTANIDAAAVNSSISPPPRSSTPAQPSSTSSTSSPATSAPAVKPAGVSPPKTAAAAAAGGSGGGARTWGAGWGKKPLVGSGRSPARSASPADVNTPAQAPSAAPPPPAAPTPTPVPTPAPASSQQSGRQAAEKKKVDGEEVEDGVVILNKRTGRDRSWKKERDPSERQATVKEALRFVSGEMTQPDQFDDEDEEYDDEGNRLPPRDPTVDRVAGIDWDKVKRADLDGLLQGSPAGSGGASVPKVDTGKEKWWQRRFQALFLPNVRYADGSVGFLQLDCSLVEGKIDMRVVTFEDRHDCMYCCKILKQWPEYEWLDLEMSALPTKAVEAEIVRAWQSQVQAGNTIATRPAGVVVFRKGKLAMRMGMTQDEFTQLVVYQAAAQLSLSKVGYEFDDF